MIDESGSTRGARVRVRPPAAVKAAVTCVPVDVVLHGLYAVVAGIAGRNVGFIQNSYEQIGVMPARALRNALGAVEVAEHAEVLSRSALVAYSLVIIFTAYKMLGGANWARTALIVIAVGGAAESLLQRGEILLQTTQSPMRGTLDIVLTLMVLNRLLFTALCMSRSSRRFYTSSTVSLPAQSGARRP